MSFKAPGPNDTGLLPDGTYDATIHACEQRTSKNGNDMLSLTLAVYTDAGQRYVYDHVMLAGPAAWRLRALCDACGFQEGEDLEAENFSDANVRVRLETEHDEKYGDKNRVKSYLAPSKAKRQVAPPPPPSDMDVPF